ncbi:MAG: YbaB/EbfC family nucleoid-associated protein [Alphaproteobacteria bacterium]|nr:YbaB/EbfC family nucleoid-associated protein [Alphaproteobacteria bacterium]
MKGLGDIGKLMQQAQEMQSKMQDAQSDLEQTLVEGKSGGGLVTVTLNGKGEMRGLEIDPSMFSEDDKEVLEDLIIAAHSEARKAMDAAVAEKMKEATAGLPIPPGMNLGF